jgi:hypothetical protein
MFDKCLSIVADDKVASIREFPDGSGRYEATIGQDENNHRRGRIALDIKTNQDAGAIRRCHNIASVWDFRIDRQITWID